MTEFALLTDSCLGRLDDLKTTSLDLGNNGIEMLARVPNEFRLIGKLHQGIFLFRSRSPLQQQVVGTFTVSPFDNVGVRSYFQMVSS